MCGKTLSGTLYQKGGVVAEWSKALLQCEEKINENHKISGSTPGPGTFIKTFLKLYQRIEFPSKFRVSFLALF